VEDVRADVIASNNDPTMIAKFNRKTIMRVYQT
jgi:hypothetical protein